MTADNVPKSLPVDIVFMSIMGFLYWVWMAFIAWHTTSPLNPLYGINGPPLIGTNIAILWTVIGLVLVTVKDGRKWIQETFDTVGMRILFVAGYLIIGWAIDYLPYAFSNGFSWGIWYFWVFMLIPGILIVIPWNDDDTLSNIIRYLLVMLAWGIHDQKLYQFSFAPDGYYNAINGLQTVFITLLAFTVYRKPFKTDIADFNITVNDVKYGVFSLFVLFLILTPTGLFLGFLALNPTNDIILYFGIFIEIFIRVAIIEELLFRDIMQRAFDNFLDISKSKARSIGSLLLVSFIFGLFHANNLSDLTNTIIYVTFAFIAGIFYAISWRFEKRILAAIITHVGVDLLWFTVFYAGTGA